LLVGAMEGVPYDSRTVALDSFSKLFLFSDGAFEIQKDADGEMWPFNEFVDLLVGIGRDATGNLDRVWQHVTVLGGSDQLDDDFSLLQVEF
jgi:phosphoserine phosphatase RsbU/P